MRKDVKRVVETYLQYRETCKQSKVTQWFRDRDIEGYVYTCQVYNGIVPVWNRRIAKEQVFNVVIDSHYVDAGSSDYVYTYSIIKINV